jgi:outer membrane protein TolC
LKSNLPETAYGKRIAQAVHTSPILAQSNARLRAAQATEEATAGAFVPQLSAGITSEATRSGGSFTTGTEPFLRVSQLVYDNGAARHTRTAARARVYQGQGERLEAASAAVLRAVETYSTLQTQRRLLTLAAENLSAHKELASQIEERSNSGLGSTADTLAAKSRLADARTRRVDAQLKVDQAEAQFREIFNLAPTTLPSQHTAPLLPLGNEKDIVTNSPRVRSIDAALKAAESELAASRASRWPSLRLGATGQESTSGTDPDVTFDLTLNYDLDTGGQRRAAIKVAQARVEELSAAREALVREISRALEFVRADRTAGVARVKAARAAAKANADTVSASREQFTVGRRSLLELLDAQRDYVSAQERAILAVQANFLTNYAALGLTGDILDVFAITPEEVASVGDGT